MAMRMIFNVSTEPNSIPTNSAPARPRWDQSTSQQEDQQQDDGDDQGDDGDPTCGHRANQPNDTATKPSEMSVAHKVLAW